MFEQAYLKSKRAIWESLYTAGIGIWNLQLKNNERKREKNLFKKL